MEPKVVLQTENLLVGYSSKKEHNVIAANINLCLSKGQLISMIGANGIGKSTLLRTLCGIQKTLDGNILLNHRNLTEYNTLALAKEMSLVLTEKLPPSNLTVFELLALGRQPHTNWLGKITPDDLLKINHAMEMTGTDIYSTKKHFEISDGQLQKVLVARALAQDTPLIILDEPTTHLDIQNKVSLFQLLKKLAHQENKCILFSTHDIDLAIQLSDEMIVMTPQFVLQDTPENLIRDNIFEIMFANSNISFDKEKVKFVFKNI